MADLTKRDERLLRHPPTNSTWECLATRKTEKNGEITTIRCGELNPGSHSKCWLCARPKPRRPKLIYPVYEAACKKAGIEPGTRWPVREEKTDDAPPKKARRKGSK